jgi:hypothetical protein
MNLIIDHLKLFHSRKTTAQIQVTVGQLSLILPDPGELRLQVRAIFIHENYDERTKFNDIAMLEVIFVRYYYFKLIIYQIHTALRRHPRR